MCLAHLHLPFLHSQTPRHHIWPMIFLPVFLKPINHWMLFFKYHCNSVHLSVRPTIAQPTSSQSTTITSMTSGRNCPKFSISHPLALLCHHQHVNKDFYSLLFDLSLLNSILLPGKQIYQFLFCCISDRVDIQGAFSAP